MIKNLTIILVVFISLNTKIFSQDLAVYCLFDISKSYKEKALDEAIEVSEYVYDVFSDTSFLVVYRRNIILRVQLMLNQLSLQNHALQSIKTLILISFRLMMMLKR